jgi:hypothetical protein
MTADLHDVGSVADQLGCGLMLLLITQDVEALHTLLFLEGNMSCMAKPTARRFPEFLSYDP